jgi:hypothetical protein
VQRCAVHPHLAQFVRWRIAGIEATGFAAPNVDAAVSQERRFGLRHAGLGGFLCGQDRFVSEEDAWIGSQPRRLIKATSADTGGIRLTENRERKAPDRGAKNQLQATRSDGILAGADGVERRRHTARAVCLPAPRGSFHGSRALSKPMLLSRQRAHPLATAPVPR